MNILDVLRSDAHRYTRHTVGALRHPGFRMTFRWRIAKALHLLGVPFVPQFIRQSIVTSYSCDWSLSAEIGPGLRVPHPIGIVIGDQARIGSGVLLMQGVTIGGNRGRVVGNRTMPIIGDNVEIGPYAQVLGPIRVSRLSRINAGTVVSRDFERDAE